MSAVWSQGSYEELAGRFAPIHDDLVARLDPSSGERWLDVGTGTGAVAIRAARAGAVVTAIDISEAMVERARSAAAAEGVDVAFDAGDAQALPYDAGAFDVVASCFGVVFAPDREAAASELGRVCRRGGRLGLTAWRPKPELRAIYERFQDRPPAADNTDWGNERLLGELLGGDFELTIEERVWMLEGDSAGGVFEWWSKTPPATAFLSRLHAGRHEEFRAAFVDHWRRFETPDGVREPRRYLVVNGSRR